MDLEFIRPFQHKCQLKGLPRDRGQRPSYRLFGQGFAHLRILQRRMDEKEKRTTEAPRFVITAPKLTVKDALEAAKIAGIADDIREMPMGMNAIISEGEGGISGGQKQRLMIARAAINKPNILIFR